MSVRIFDMTVHTWDLARSLSVDEMLDEALVRWVLEQYEGPLSFISQAFTPTAQPVSGDASARERLLHLTGRSA